MKEINVEEIMDEIRADIKRRNLSEDDLNFQDIKRDGFSSGAFNSNRLADELGAINLFAMIELNGDVGGSGLKRLIKRILRKSVRFYVQPLWERQNEFNTHCVRILNEMNLYISECELKRQELEQRITELEGHR